MITRDDLNVVVEANQTLQTRARELNIQNGSDVFPIMSQSEMKTWLTERLAGARAIVEIPHLDDLYLPELDQALIAKVLADNPNEIEVDGVATLVEYGRNYSGLYVKIQVEESLARNTQLAKVTLPGGRDVTLVCGSHSADNFADLVAKLEKSRIDRAWSEVRGEHEHTSWISSPDDVFPHLEKLLTSVEITRADNGTGEPIYGYFSLHSDSDPDFQIRLKSQAEAEEETKVGLERLLKKATRQELKVPQEEPWQKQGWGWEMTEMGQALKTSLSSLTEATTDDLTPANVQEKIEKLKAEVEKIKLEIGGQFVEHQGSIDRASEIVNEKIEAVGYNDKDFVRSEMEEARNLINQAKEALKGLNYDQINDLCSQATYLAESLAELVRTRSAARDEAKEAYTKVQSSLRDIYYRSGNFGEASSDEVEGAETLLREINSDLEEGRYDKALEKIEIAKNLIVSAEKAGIDRVLAEEASKKRWAREIPGNDGIYGMPVDEDQRYANPCSPENAVAWVLYRAIYRWEGHPEEFVLVPYKGYRSTRTGRTFAELVYEFTDEHLIEEDKPTAIPTPSDENKNKTTFVDLGMQRYFQCQACNGNTRLTKSDYAAYKAGETVAVTCDCCEAKGEVVLSD